VQAQQVALLLEQVVLCFMVAVYLMLSTPPQLVMPWQLFLKI
jgi:hypothetical protein